ncbi:GNAT family N-acetyltransferase [Enterococcus massiliensis]|uniref:GNAT family N-acetyltransferase n=1 Tax=Enterococcus massiliensis TaxID=1640685 RepID=UPI00065E4164|nr:GNAT family N-acetyltransferase [Enterococcus massiliensis]
MREEVDVVIRESQPEDAAELLAVTRRIGGETDFLIMDETGMQLTTEQLALQLTAFQESPNNVSLVALVDGKIVGLASVLAESNERVGHIGELGISISKEFWGMGLGSVMMEELLAWAQETQIIRRLELTVQVRNQRAVRLYQRFEFTIEGTLPRGARSREGEFLDVYLMSRLID